MLGVCPSYYCPLPTARAWGPPWLHTGHRRPYQLLTATPVASYALWAGGKATTSKEKKGGTEGNVTSAGGMPLLLLPSPNCSRLGPPPWLSAATGAHASCSQPHSWRATP